MIIVILIIYGLVAGSFVNALVWRIHENSKKSKTNGSKKLKKLSIVSGRSECVKCHHLLGPLDLIPILSWMMLKEKCHYCNKTISAVYPLTELLTTGLVL